MGENNDGIMEVKIMEGKKMELMNWNFEKIEKIPDCNVHSGFAMQILADFEDLPYDRAVLRYENYGFKPDTLAESLRKAIKKRDLPIRVYLRRGIVYLEKYFSR